MKLLPSPSTLLVRGTILLGSTPIRKVLVFFGRGLEAADQTADKYTEESRMRTDSPVREAAERACPEDPTGATLREPVVRPAPLLDVMMEQIAYLAGHAAEACPPACPDCVRLEQVKRWLLAPFR